ncbi:MAG: hypothetical protein J3R72DRAFT_499142 [Linnemannia gamsii]|nr:MAG: hypothetical protein J3R72DRAFT_499142 [Linnemannia gamsii]
MFEFENIESNRIGRRTSINLRNTTTNPLVDPSFFAFYRTYLLGPESFRILTVSHHNNVEESAASSAPLYCGQRQHILSRCTRLSTVVFCPTSDPDYRLSWANRPSPGSRERPGVKDANNPDGTIMKEHFDVVFAEIKAPKGNHSGRLYSGGQVGVEVIGEGYDRSAIAHMANDHLYLLSTGLVCTIPQYVHTPPQRDPDRLLPEDLRPQSTDITPSSWRFFGCIVNTSTDTPKSSKRHRMRKAAMDCPLVSRK